VSRLRSAFVLLVIGPAVAFAALGAWVAGSSRASLGPQLDRHAAQRGVEYLRIQRERLANEMTMPPERLGARAGDLGVERFTIYNASDRVVATFPDESPVPISLGTEQANAMLTAARRGQTVVDLVLLEDRPLWLAYVPAEDRLAVALVSVDRALAERFARTTGYDLAVYHGLALALSSSGEPPPALDAALLDSLTSLDRAATTSLGDRQVAAAPFKDFDEWDITGAVVTSATESAPSLPSFPILPTAALALAAMLTAFLAWRLTLRPARGDMSLRRGFAIALIPPAVAAAWLAASDARISARATDALLDLSGRSVALAGDAAFSLSPGRLAALAGADIVVLDGDSAVAASDPELTAETFADIAGAAGRISDAGRKRAYRIEALSGNRRAVLVAAPLEDSRKQVLFWLAGLYGLLAATVLIYASLSFAARNGLALREAIAAWSFLTPSLILLLLFSAVPLLFAFYLSFHGWNLLEPAKPFVGLRHYIDLATDGLFWNAVKNTAIYSLYVPATMACALAVALLLNRSIKGVALLRAVFFLPYITSFVAISIVWQWMYDPNFGVFNWALGFVGLGPYPWLNSPATALLALIIMAVWIHIGFQMIIFLAGLQAIPNELYEAAMIDGAGPWRRFWRITLPLLRPTTFFVLVTSIIGSFQVFTFVYVMTEGGPLHATDVIVYHIYQNAWQFLRMGYASAMSWVLFAVIFAVTLLQFRFLGRRMAPGT
jgi:multiple sugar transport system permease protein